MTRYAAIYCRLSPRPDGSYEGVDLQEKWGRDYAASAWPDLPVRVFADAGISAANGDHRPAYEQLRAAIVQGDVARLWVVEQTRLERREVEWFALAAELDAAGITELHTNRDGTVRVRDEVAGIKAVLAAGEVRKLRRRVNDRLAEIAAEGRPAGARPYGYRHTLDEQGKKTLAIVDEQAAVIRDAAEKVLAGWSLARVAAVLDGQGLRGAHGGRIAGWTVRKMLTNPTVAGLRVHQGRIVGKGVWEPILDEQTWHAVRNRLAAPRVVACTDGTAYPVSGASRWAGRRYLLTGGLAVCGVCGAPLVASMKQLKGGRRTVPYYLCHPKAGGRACVGIMGEQLEQHVVDLLLDELDKPDFLAALAADDHADQRDRIVRELRGIDDQRNDLAAMWAAQDLTAAEWQTARRALAEHEQQLRQTLAGIPAAVSHVDPTLIRAGWEAMNLDERREIVSLFVERVIVKRAKPGTKGFDTNRVDIAWRTR
ncbi:MAG TPA: recombinase family protein [Kribbellaceae bacterium]|nr:recombinase family protein [Kribbellaceae bacterium]